VNVGKKESKFEVHEIEFLRSLEFSRKDHTVNDIIKLEETNVIKDTERWKLQWLNIC
jgi:hypothetical protein